MFGLSHTSHEASPLHNGILDPNNRRRFDEFLRSLDKKKEYRIYEYDIQGNMYHSGVKSILGSELPKIYNYLSHVTHSYILKDTEGLVICRIAYTFDPMRTPERVHEILH